MTTDNDYSGDNPDPNIGKRKKMTEQPPAPPGTADPRIPPPRKAEWYYLNKNQDKQGPFSEKNLTFIFQKHGLFANTMVWRSGFEEWTRADETAELKPLFQEEGLQPPEPPAPPDTADPLAPPSREAALPQGETLLPPAPLDCPMPEEPDDSNRARPWIRFWARTFDMIMVAVAVVIPLVLIFPDPFFPGVPGSEKLEELLIDLIFVWIWYPILEPFCLSVFGTTLGKKLFKIKLRLSENREMTFPRAFKRSMGVFVKGIAFGIPPFSIIAMMVARSRLKKRGIASWDQKGGFIVSHEKLGAWRVFFIILFFLVFYALMIWARMEAI